MTRVQIFDDVEDQVDLSNLIARMRAEHDGGVKSLTDMHTIGLAWHTARFGIGQGWLGEAVATRLMRAGLSPKGLCWGNILFAGAEYSAHAHPGANQVAVWCLDDSGGALHIEPDTVVPDRAGRLVVFTPSQKHWVPKVTRDRFTIAANIHV